MLKRIFLILSICLILVSPALAIELEINKQELTKESRVIDDDYLFLGKALVFDGQANDLYLAGASITFNGKALSGLTAFGESVEINGTVGNDAVLGGNRVAVNGQITGTVFTGANEFILAQDSVINGDIFIGSANSKIYGTVNGDVKIGSGVLVIDGTINGNVTAGTGDIVLSDNGRINGDFYYTAENALSEADRGKISGTVTFDKNETFRNKFRGNLSHFMKAAGTVFFIVMNLSLLILGLLLFLFPLFRNLPQRNTHKEFWFPALWGLIPFFIYPVLVVLLIVLIISIPLGFLILLAALPVLAFTQIIGMKFAGDYLFTLFRWKNENRFVHFLLGFAVFFILGLIPFIKLLAFILFSSLGWGMIIEQLFKKKLTDGGNSTGDPAAGES